MPNDTATIASGFAKVLQQRHAGSIELLRAQPGEDATRYAVAVARAWQEFEEVWSGRAALRAHHAAAADDGQ